MDLRQMRYFLAVASDASMRKAAVRLHIAQPALSRQIRNLENDIGCSLFERRNKRLSLTTAGAAFVKEAQNLIAAADAAIRLVQRTAQGTAGLLRVGFIDTAAWEGPFPAGIRRFHQDYPDVSLSLVPMFSKTQLDEIEKGNIDGGFCYAMERLPKHFGSIDLRVDRLELAVPTWSEWANHTKVRVDHLGNEPFIWINKESAPAYVQAKEKALLRAGLVPRVVQEVADETSLLSLVAAGVGLAFVNSANASRKPASVSLIPLQNVKFALPMIFAWRMDNISPTLKALCRTLTNTL
jgi:DNA-binding transcriptional LysR family regulator